MGVLTWAPRKVLHTGDRKEVIGDLTDTGSYVVGGDLPASGTIAQLIGFDYELNNLDCQVAVTSTGVLLAKYNEATGNLQLFTSNGAAPAVFVALTAITIPGGPAVIRVHARGKGSVTPQ
jgi:hypothetical protein